MSPLVTERAIFRSAISGLLYEQHMHRRNEPSITFTWLLAAIVPILAAGAAWLWMGITTSAHHCATGTGSNSLGLAGLAVLMLIGPIVVGWRSRRTRIALAQAASPIATSILLGLPLIVLASEAWWGSHNCYT